MQAVEMYRECVKELSAFARRHGFSECVIGMSGGIDSSLVTAMCVDAFGAERVHGCMLPGPYSSAHSLEDAQRLAGNLGIDARVISITEPYEAFARVLSDSCGGVFEGLASENTQARCRTVCLMALSNQHGWMMANTSNKSEAMMGYSTLYGDTAGAFAPIGGLYKTTVYEVARACNEIFRSRGQVPPIPGRVFSKAPSAELAPGQEDESSLGVSYEELDRILIGHYERDLSAVQLANDRICAEKIARLIAMADSYAFKRAVEPPYPETKFYA